MACPVELPDARYVGSHLFMGLAVEEIFQIGGPTAQGGVDRYTWPGFDFIENVVDLTDFDGDFGANWPAPGLLPQGSVIVGPDGDFYMWVQDNNGVTNTIGVAHVSADGSTADLIYETTLPSIFTDAGAMLAWHPETPGVLWTDVGATTSGVPVFHDLATIDMTTGSRTDVVDLLALGYDALPPTPSDININQYATGLVFGVSAVGYDADLFAYDVVSDTYDTITPSSSMFGFGTLYVEQVIYWSGGDVASAIEIDTTGSVSLSNITADCVDLWLVDDGGPFYVDLRLWISDINRTVFYWSDNAYLWGAAAAGRKWWCGAAGWG